MTHEGIQTLCSNETLPMSELAAIRATRNCTALEQMENERFTVSVYGHVSVTVGLLTLITNWFVCLVLLQKNLRTPTNLLLVAMAIADTLTGVLPIPTFFFFYTLGNYRYFVPYSWCLVNPPLMLHLPTVTHTASIWLTVALAVQRYICVCHPQSAKSLCTVRNAMKSIVAIYVVAAVSQASRFFEYLYYPYEIHTGKTMKLNVESAYRASDSFDEVHEVMNAEGKGEQLSDNTVFVGCYQKLSAFVNLNPEIYYSVYWWFRVIFIHLIPCILLVILNALLFNAMRKAQARRDVLLRQNRRTESHRLAESNLATLMLVAVVTVFLLVELPLAILLITMIYENTFEHRGVAKLLEPEERRVASLFINLGTLLSYPVNFFIYCAMSRQFRETFKSLFLCRTTAGGLSHSRHPRGSNCQTLDIQMTRVSVAQ